MKLVEWYNENNADDEMINWIEHMKKLKSYTDEEIIDAINKIHKISLLCGGTLKGTIALLVSNETMGLR